MDWLEAESLSCYLLEGCSWKFAVLGCSTIENAPRFHRGAFPIRYRSLLPCDHLLHENLPIHLELIQVDARCNVLARLGVFAIPIGDVITASQRQVLDCLAPSSVTASALQSGHSNQLRQQIVDPQSDSV